MQEYVILPIWDTDSGFYWTGYYTDNIIRKIYCGRYLERYLYAVRKAFTPIYTVPNLLSHK